MSRTNALHSLYGGKISRLRREDELAGKALSGNVGGQKRNQTVLTPEWFIDQLVDSYGALGYDPCTTAWNPLKAKVFSTEETNGLKISWARMSVKYGWIYVNPPYDDLKCWLDKCLQEAEAGAKILLLGPIRPWRTWFCDLTKNYDVISLAPLAFRGEKSAFPAPLCVIPYNLPTPKIVNLRISKNGKSSSKNMITGIWRQAA